MGRILPDDGPLVQGPMGYLRGMPGPNSLGKGRLALLASLPLAAAVALPATPRPHASPADASTFPRELVDWVPHEGNPLFAGTSRDTWDREIRERGFILRDGNTWRLWYTGYDSTKSETKSLGYATSPDGLVWTRHPKNPVFDGVWTEDVFVLKHGGLFHMYAEGANDVAHRLTSADGVRWEEQAVGRRRRESRSRQGPTGPRPSGSRTGPSTCSTSATTRGSGSRPRRT
jgi:hypothetical protein